jgi:hypothetical protein
MERKHQIRGALLALLLISIFTPLGAQRRPLQFDRQWEQGPLTFNDFRGRPSLSAEASFAELTLGLATMHDTVDGIVVPYPSAAAVMKPYGSWMMPAARTEARLRYHQLQFDLLENERRRLQNELNYGLDYHDILLDSAYSRLMQTFDSLRTTTADGTDTAALSRWQESVALSPFMHTSLPSRQKLVNTMLVEGSLGLGFMGYTSSLSRCFRNGFSFNLMLDVLYRRHMVAFDMNIGSTIARDTLWNYRYNDYYYTDRSTTDIRFMIEYGYRIVNTNLLSLTPFAGIGIHRLDQGTEEIPFFATAATAGGGLLFQHHIFCTLNPPRYGSIDRYDLNFTARLMAAYSRFTQLEGKPSGWSFFIQLGMGIGGGRYRFEG